jgi:hypothetical protein
VNDKDIPVNSAQFHQFCDWLERSGGKMPVLDSKGGGDPPPVEKKMIEPVDEDSNPEVKKQEDLTLSKEDKFNLMFDMMRQLSMKVDKLETQFELKDLPKLPSLTTQDKEPRQLDLVKGVYTSEESTKPKPTKKESELTEEVIQDLNTYMDQKGDSEEIKQKKQEYRNKLKQMSIYEYNKLNRLQKLREEEADAESIKESKRVREEFMSPPKKFITAEEVMDNMMHKTSAELKKEYGNRESAEEFVKKVLEN